MSGFPGSSVVEPAANAGDRSSIPDPYAAEQPRP